MGSVTPAVPTSYPPTGSLEPTWCGFVFSTKDALTIFESCLRGDLHAVPRRPHDRERPNLITSGSVFVYREADSGIKRWTDGIPWSPSRILGNFLIYRELEKAFAPGEKKRALKRGNKRGDRLSETYSRGESSEDVTATPPKSPQIPTTPNQEDFPLDRNNERALIGSLTDSYTFREGGLVKKTITVHYENVHYHLVSYYTIDDVQSYTLKTPSESGFPFAPPRRELWEGQNFRSSEIESYEAVPAQYQQGRNMYSPYPYMSTPVYSQHAPQIVNPSSYGQVPYGVSQHPFRSQSHEHHSPQIGPQHFSASPPNTTPEVYTFNMNASSHIPMKSPTNPYGSNTYSSSHGSVPRGIVPLKSTSTDSSQHLPHMQSMLYQQNRMPPESAGMSLDSRGSFSHSDIKTDHGDMARSIFSSQGWAVGNPTAEAAFNDGRRWAGGNNQSPGSYVAEDAETVQSWHPGSR